MIYEKYICKERTKKIKTRKTYIIEVKIPQRRLD